MFALRPQLYPPDSAVFFIRDYFRFLDDVFYKWLDNFDIEPFYSMINNLDPDLKFIFESPPKSLNFLDINIQIVENNLVFDTHYKPTNSFNYWTYTSCHLPHTSSNISLPLAKRIVSVETNNRENRLKELKEQRYYWCYYYYSNTITIDKNSDTITIDAKLNFEKHINDIIKKAFYSALRRFPT